MTEKYDVAIIGAGPAGAVFAKELIRKAPGLRVLLVDGQDEHSKKVCGGLLAPDAQEMFAKLGLTLPTDILADPHADPVRRMTAILEAGVISDQMYAEFLQGEIGKAGYRDFFRVLLETPEGNAVLWHCTNGKDRTGVAAMLLLGVLNVDEETIMEDFMLTNLYFEEEISAMQKQLGAYIQDEGLMEDFLVASKGVAASYMRNAIDYIKENYGSIPGYVKAELGLTDADIVKLKMLYTE